MEVKDIKKSQEHLQFTQTIGTSQKLQKSLPYQRFFANLKNKIRKMLD